MKTICIIVIEEKRKSTSGGKRAPFVAQWKVKNNFHLFNFNLLFISNKKFKRLNNSNKKKNNTQSRWVVLWAMQKKRRHKKDRKILTSCWNLKQKRMLALSSYYSVGQSSCRILSINMNLLKFYVKKSNQEVIKTSQKTKLL